MTDALPPTPTATFTDEEQALAQQVFAALEARGVVVNPTGLAPLGVQIEQVYPAFSADEVVQRTLGVEVTRRFTHLAHAAARRRVLAAGAEIERQMKEIKP